MKKINYYIVSLLIIFNFCFKANAQDFEDWLNNFKMVALQNGISESTFNIVMKDAKFLPDVIKYDRYQPEFYENTKTYVNKRSSNEKVIIGKKIYKDNFNLINKVSKEYNVDKELLLSLMGIETNFGNYLGKMDIISSLSTLSYDKRRSEFFTNELIKILQLIDKGIIDHKTLYGSWAGAFGNFQFMPSTIMNYAIDYNKDEQINLKSYEDSFASAANYINQLGWNPEEPCFLKVDLSDTTPSYLLNSSAKKISNKRKFKDIKKYLKNTDNIMFNENLVVGIITPDKEIVENPNPFNPAFIIFQNYELILKWNRSLRFGLAVCTLKDKFKNAL
tara:strand:+ start:278 stop:1276 length:999 start_codon:yes stop_codon:yes gene_type:complete